MARYHNLSYLVPALIGGDRDLRFAPLSNVESSCYLSGASIDALYVVVLYIIRLGAM